MNTFVCQCLLLILIYTKSVQNYPSGAPSSTCVSMTPGHGVSSQACAPNYIITSDKTQYNTNDIVHITVNGSTSADTFKGILLIAKTATSGQIIGTWSISNTDLQSLACNGVANTGVTHNSGNEKNSVDAFWSPPSTTSGENTIIRATIVKAYSTIYVNCFSVTLTSRQTSTSTSATNVTISSTSSTTIATTTTTTTVPVTSNAGVSISWMYVNGITSVTMQIGNLQRSQWLALGLSLDQTMGNDHVFVCKRLADNTIATERRINPNGHSYPELATTTSGGTFNITRQSLVDGTAYCQFTLSNFSGTKRQRRAVTSLSQSTSYYPLIAMGNLDPSNALIQHTSRLALSQTVQLNQQENIVYNLNSSGSNLVKAHGILMLFAWIFFASTGILIARHFKTAWPERKLCGKGIWFGVHRSIMLSVVLLTIIAFILILVYTKGTWVPSNAGSYFAHSIIGIIVISFAIIQPIMALFRCKPDGEYRFIFNYVHAFVGSSAFLLSIVAIFLAMFFPLIKAQGDEGWGLLVAWTCWIVMIFVVFGFVDFYFRKNRINPEHVDSYNLDNTTPKIDSITAQDQAKEDRIKLALLVMHILVALGIAIALAVFIGNI